uniref:Secreted protein n=1 Tax=Syphacia muris TaxID=451379 RepID=A0A0N5AIY3_9BILA
MRDWLVLITFPVILAAFDIDLKPFVSRYSPDAQSVDELQLSHFHNTKSSSVTDDDYSDNSADASDPNTTKLLQQYYWLLTLMLSNYTKKNATENLQESQKQISLRNNTAERYSEDPELPREVQPPPL